jgi:hypothetical protein
VAEPHAHARRVRPEERPHLTRQLDGRPAAHPLQRGDELFAGVEVTARPRTAVGALALSVRSFGLRFCRHVYHGEKGF